jgi:hypothetical protein
MYCEMYRREAFANKSHAEQHQENEIGIYMHSAILQKQHVSIHQYTRITVVCSYLLIQVRLEF